MSQRVIEGTKDLKDNRGKQRRPVDGDRETSVGNEETTGAVGSGHGNSIAQARSGG